MLTLPNFLDALERRPRSPVARAGFVLADVAVPSEEEGDGLGLLQYRIGPAGQPSLLLDVSHVPEDRTITVELWSPGDLAGVTAESRAETVAIRRREWLYDVGADPDALSRAVADEVAAWLDDLGMAPAGP